MGMAVYGGLQRRSDLQKKATLRLASLRAHGPAQWPSAATPGEALPKPLRQVLEDLDSSGRRSREKVLGRAVTALEMEVRHLRAACQRQEIVAEARLRAEVRGLHGQLCTALSDRARAEERLAAAETKEAERSRQAA